MCRNCPSKKCKKDASEVSTEAFFCLLHRSGAFFDLADVVGRGLVDAIVQPVGIQQVSAGAPADDGGLGGVVIGKIIGEEV